MSPTKNSSKQQLEAAQHVQSHFRRKARSFDRLYDEQRLLQRLVRPGLLRRREFALETVRASANPRVLDIGCGSGRVGELALEEGACEYTGIDVSEPMLSLANTRLHRFDQRVKLIHGDFLSVSIDTSADVVLALGLFDYIPEPQQLLQRMHELCSGTVVISFPRWTWTKGPLRLIRYRVINRCPIYNYREPDILSMLKHAGFHKIEARRTRGGFLVRAKS